MRASDSDGVSTLVFPPNVASAPVELLEVKAPLLGEKKALVPDSGGPGRQRGGLGQEIVIRNVSRTPVVASVIGGRFHEGAPGLETGARGGTGVIAVNDGAPLGESSQVLLGHGDRIRMRFPGGGGFGDPRQRAPEAVLADVRRGFVSVERARDDYGVALRPAGGRSTPRRRAGCGGTAGAETDRSETPSGSPARSPAAPRSGSGPPSPPK